PAKGSPPSSTTLKTGPLAFFALTGRGVGVGTSCHVKATPANDANQGSSWGYAVAGSSWRCRCGPVAWPVWPTRPTGEPAASAAPGTTVGSSTDRWQYVQLWPSPVVSV